MPNAQPGALSIGAELIRDISDQQLLERFVARNDEAAFAGLLQRYGRMVWGVCRRVLRQEQDVEDAFQAVFFVLARKAASIRKREAVGSWLYGVASRIARKAQKIASHRQTTEKQATGAAPSPPPWGQAACAEFQRLLDEEVERLPEKYRAPFVLCCLEGMSREEAARELGLKEGTLSSRLAQARKLLQNRLVRRGVTLSSALTAVALTQQLATAAAPPVLMQTTATAVLATQNGATAISPAAAALAKSHLQRTAMKKVGVVLGVLLVGLLLLGGATVAAVLLRSGWGAADGGGAIEPETFLPPPVALGTPVGEAVLTVAFSPDGKRLVTAGAWGDLPGQLKVWDVATRQELVTIGRIPGVRTAAFSPDGNALATGDCNGDVTLRDPTTGEVRKTAQGHNGGVSGVAFSHNGELLASVGLDSTVKLWNARLLQEPQVLPGHTDKVSAVAFFRQRQAIVTGSQDQTAKIWDIHTGKETFTLLGHKSAVEAVAVAPDDKVVATASSDETVRLWDAETGAEIAVLEGNKGNAFFAVAFSPDGKLLAAAGRDGKIQVWDAKTRQLIATREKHTEAVWALAFSRAGLLASGSADKTARLWQFPGEGEPATLTTSWSAIRPIHALAYAPDGTVLAVATRDRTVHLRDASSGDVLKVLAGHGDNVTCVAFAPNGKTLVSGSSDKTLKVWDRAGGAERTLTGHTGAVQALAFAPDGKKFASAGDDQTIRLWDAVTGKELATLQGHEAPLRALAFSPDGLTLASGGADRTIKTWDLASGTATLSLQEHEGTVRALAFSCDGVLASGSEDTTVKLWDLAKGSARLTLKGHSRAVLALAFSPKGRTLVSGSQDATVRVWDPSNGRPRGTLKKHLDAVTALAIHPQGLDLVSGSQDTLLLRWSAGAIKALEAPRRDALPVGDPDAARRKAAAAAPLAQAPNDQVLDPRPANASRRGWLLVAVLLFLTILGASLGAWLLARRSRRPEGNEESQPPVNALLALPCPGCGKKLKVKTTLAGTKVRCPQCRIAVDVPEAEVTPLPPPSTPRWAWAVAVGAFVCVAVGLAGWAFLTRQGTDQPVSYLDRPFGAEPVPGIDETGFYDPEVSSLSGVAYRWTNGSARLVVPLTGPPPKVLYVRLILPGRLGYRLQIRVNGQSLFDERLAVQGLWTRTLDLSDVSLGKELTLEILSDTFVPAEQNKASNDQRVLGIRVAALTLCSKPPSYADVPLGIEEESEVKESGFHGPEFRSGQGSRWTDGSARLSVPLRGKVPRTLALTLEIHNLPDYHLQIVVNGKTLFDDVVKPNSNWTIELPLAGVDLGETANVELNSSTFVPAQVFPPSGDQRKLGVKVKRLILLTDAGER